MEHKGQYPILLDALEIGAGGSALGAAVEGRML
jgi:hypothetical protein